MTTCPACGLLIERPTLCADCAEQYAEEVKERQQSFRDVYPQDFTEAEIQPELAQ